MVTLNNSSVSDNTAAVGGGIANYYGGSIRISDSTVRHNPATTVGGGVFVFAGGSITLIGTSTISANTPDNCFPPGSIPDCIG